MHLSPTGLSRLCAGGTFPFVPSLTISTSHARSAQILPIVHMLDVLSNAPPCSRSNECIFANELKFGPESNSEGGMISLKGKKKVCRFEVTVCSINQSIIRAGSRAELHALRPLVGFQPAVRPVRQGSLIRDVLSMKVSYYYYSTSGELRR